MGHQAVREKAEKEEEEGEEEEGENEEEDNTIQYMYFHIQRICSWWKLFVNKHFY